MNAPIISRRSFAKGMGGIVLAFSLTPVDLLAQAAPASLSATPLFSIDWLPKVKFSFGERAVSFDKTVTRASGWCRRW